MQDRTKAAIDGIKNTPTQTVINFTNEELGDDGIKLLVDALAQRKLTELHLVNCAITPAGMQLLKPSLNISTDLRHFSVKNFPLDLDLMNILARTTKMETLYLENCGIDNALTPPLAAIFKNNPELTDINLRDNNKMGDAMLVPLLNELKDRPMEQLDLHNCGLTIEPAKKLLIPMIIDGRDYSSGEIIFSANQFKPIELHAELRAISQKMRENSQNEKHVNTLVTHIETLEKAIKSTDDKSYKKMADLTDMIQSLGKTTQSMSEGLEKRLLAKIKTLEESQKDLDNLHKQKHEELLANMPTEQDILNNMLFNAAKKGNTGAIESALVHGADINAKNKEEKTAYHLSVLAAHEEASKLLLKKSPQLFSAKDSTGNTALQSIVATDNLEVIDWAYEDAKSTLTTSFTFDAFKDVLAKATPAAKAMLMSKTLWESATKDDDEGVKFSLKNGAKINGKEKDDKTALHKAVEAKNGKIVDLLIREGADTSIINMCGDTPYEAAKKTDCEHTIRIFSNHSLLTAVLKNSSTEVLEALTKDKADINSTRDNNNTPVLHLAVSQGNIDLVKLFLQRGADIQVKDAEGQVALHKAVLNLDEKMISLLLKKHASSRIDIMQCADNHGKTPYQLALAKNENLAGFVAQKFGNYEAPFKEEEKKKRKLLSQSTTEEQKSLLQSGGFFASGNVMHTSPTTPAPVIKNNM